MCSSPDPASPAFRSWLMSRVRSRNTKPEWAVRRLVFSMGYRYRLHDKRLPGTPDLVFPGRKKVIWVQGCFWHGHDCPNGARIPKTNVPFWTQKKRDNQDRDDRNHAALTAMGWKVLVIWECQIRDPRLRERVRRFLG